MVVVAHDTEGVEIHAIALHAFAKNVDKQALVLIGVKYVLAPVSPGKNVIDGALDVNAYRPCHMLSS
jgi:hypothetical protein